MLQTRARCSYLRGAIESVLFEGFYIFEGRILIEEIWNKHLKRHGKDKVSCDGPAVPLLIQGLSC